MKTTPDADRAWVIRTDFSCDESWAEACREIMVTHRVINLDVTANVHLLDDRKFNDMASTAVVSSLPKSYDFDYCFIYDSTSNKNPDYPVLVLNLDRDTDSPNETFEFRTYPEHIFSIDANLSICNMDFDDFMRDLPIDTVFNGFEKPENY